MEYDQYLAPTSKESSDSRRVRQQREAIRDAALAWLRDHPNESPIPVNRLAEQLRITGLSAQQVKQRLSHACSHYPSIFLVNSSSVTSGSTTTIALQPSMRTITSEEWQQQRLNRQRAKRVVQMLAYGR